MPLTDSILPMYATPSLHADDDRLETQGQASPALATEADAGQAGDRPVKSAQSRTQGVIMHATVGKEDACQSLSVSKTH